MKQQYTDVTVLIDASGSMSSMASDVIGSMKEFINKQKETDGECTMTLVYFNSANPHEVVFENQSIRSVSAPDQHSYRPSGGTPLIQAAITAIECTGTRLKELPKAARPEKVVFMIFTDGLENASGFGFTRDRLAGMIKHQEQKYNWQFSFLGCNFDAIEEGGNIGLAMASSATYHASSLGLRSSVGMMASKLASYRSSTSDSMGFTLEEQASLAGDPENSESPPNETKLP